ncbi:MAG TPA: hypothetical protein VHB48_01625 [Chitinophagaceae bacterium]|nr:hypothetical protein [Chitinophagaceae bacterium]
MKKIVLFAVSLITLGVIPAGAQVVTAYGDTVSTLSGIMKAYYDVVTVNKGGKVSYERDSCLHIKKAGVGIISHGKDGKPALHYITLKEYHKRSDTQLEKDGFDEREISRKVEQFGNMYHVWSTYESRNTAGGPVIERGINSIELFFDGTRFWITSWTFDNESKNNPLPEKYLQ